MDIFSDYDLSLVCTSRCDGDYLQCVSVCSSKDCQLDCNRAAVACAEGENIFNNIFFDNQCHFIKLVPVIQTALMDAMDVKTQFAFVM